METFEDVVSIHTLGEFFLHIEVSLVGSFGHDSGIEEVKNGVSGDDCRGVLSEYVVLVWASDSVCLVDGLAGEWVEESGHLVEVWNSPMDTFLKIYSLTCEWVVNWSEDVSSVRVFYSFDWIEISPAGVNVHSIHNAIGIAVGPAWDILCVGCSCGIITDVFSWESLEYGPTLTGFNVENHLRVHFVGMHAVVGFIKIKCIQVRAGKGDEARCSMLGKGDEDLALTVALEDFASADSTQGSSVPLDDVQEVGRSDVLGPVVDVPTSVDVISVGSVEDLSREGVLGAICKIVVSHDNDMILRDSVLLHDLVGVTDVYLVAVVAVGVWTVN
jgi:hypothetical protein